MNLIKILVCFVRLLQQVHYYFLGKQSTEYSRQHPWHSVELYRRGSAHSTVTTPLSAGGRLLVSWYKWVPAKTMSWVSCETAAWIILANTGADVNLPSASLQFSVYYCKRKLFCYIKGPLNVINFINHWLLAVLLTILMLIDRVFLYSFTLLRNNGFWEVLFIRKVSVALATIDGYRATLCESVSMKVADW